MPLLATSEVPEQPVAEREHEQRADQVEEAVEGGVAGAAGGEQGFEAEALAGGVDGVLHGFPEDARDGDGGEDARPGVAVAAAGGAAPRRARRRWRIWWRARRPAPWLASLPSRVDDTGGWPE